MNKLFALRQKIKDIYTRYDAWLSPAVKAVTMLIIILVINSHIGYSQPMTSWNIVLLAVLLAAILPWQGMTVISIIFLTINLFAMSWEVGIVAIIFLMMFIIAQYLALPGYSLTLILIPVSYFLHIPFAVPLILGVLGGVNAFIPSTMGCFMYFFFAGIEKNADFFLRTTGAGASASEQIPQIFAILAENNLMLIGLIAFCATTALVGIIKKISTDYAPYIAVTIGTILSMVIYLIGAFTTDVTISYVDVFVGGILSLAIAAIAILWLTAVDYGHTEYLLFEDENYVYNVKAIPKVKIAAKEVKISDITSSIENEPKTDEAAKKPAAKPVNNLTETAKPKKPAGTRKKPVEDNPLKSMIDNFENDNK